LIKFFLLIIQPRENIFIKITDKSVS